MELLFIDNPNYLELIENYPHLKGVNVNDNDTKASLPVHLVLGSGEYARIKTENLRIRWQKWEQSLPAEITT